MVLSPLLRSTASYYPFGVFNHFFHIPNYKKGRHDHMIIGLGTTFAMSAYHH